MLSSFIIKVIIALGILFSLFLGFKCAFILKKHLHKSSLEFKESKNKVKISIDPSQSPIEIQAAQMDLEIRISQETFLKNKTILNKSFKSLPCQRFSSPTNQEVLGMIINSERQRLGDEEVRKNKLEKFQKEKIIKKEVIVQDEYLTFDPIEKVEEYDKNYRKERIRNDSINEKVEIQKGSHSDFLKKQEELLLNQQLKNIKNQYKIRRKKMLAKVEQKEKV